MKRKKVVIATMLLVSIQCHFASSCGLTYSRRDRNRYLATGEKHVEGFNGLNAFLKLVGHSIFIVFVYLLPWLPSNHLSELR